MSCIGISVVIPCPARFRYIAVIAMWLAKITVTWSWGWSMCAMMILSCDAVEVLNRCSRGRSS